MQVINTIFGIKSTLVIVALSLMAFSAGCGTEQPIEAAQEDVNATAEEEIESKEVEVEVGEYRFRISDPTSNTTTKFNFRLVALVDEKNEEAFHAIVQRRAMRLRDRVLITSRESTNDELEDPELKMFRKRLLREMNETLESNYMKELLLTHYWVKTR